MHLLMCLHLLGFVEDQFARIRQFIWVLEGCARFETCSKIPAVAQAGNSNLRVAPRKEIFVENLNSH